MATAGESRLNPVVQPEAIVLPPILPNAQLPPWVEPTAAVAEPTTVCETTTQATTRNWGRNAPPPPLSKEAAAAAQRLANYLTAMTPYPISLGGLELAHPPLVAKSFLSLALGTNSLRGPAFSAFCNEKLAKALLQKAPTESQARLMGGGYPWHVTPLAGTEAVGVATEAIQLVFVGAVAATNAAERPTHLNDPRTSEPFVVTGLPHPFTLILPSVEPFTFALFATVDGLTLAIQDGRRFEQAVAAVTRLPQWSRATDAKAGRVEDRVLVEVARFVYRNFQEQLCNPALVWAEYTKQSALDARLAACKSECV